MTRWSITCFALAHPRHTPDICNADQRILFHFSLTETMQLQAVSQALMVRCALEKVYIAWCTLNLGQTDNSYAASMITCCTLQICELVPPVSFLDQPMHVNRNTPIMTAIAALYSQAVLQALQWNILGPSLVLTFICFGIWPPK